MELERAISPSGSSATSTASHSRLRHIFRCPPLQPNCSDPQVWSAFLAAYQNGEWERCATEPTAPMRSCSKKARKVTIEGGGVIDTADFFEQFGYLAAPPAPKEKCKVRREALLRHGFDGPQIRPSVNRYARHVKSVFKCDFVSVSVASSDDKSTLFLGTEGSACAHMIATNTTMCGHAMLLDEDEVFVVPDLAEDWRFKHLVKDPKHSMRFYASAPILLSTQTEGEEDKLPVHVGRLTIMRREPWADFGDAEAEILLDIARMTQEALENEYLQNYAKMVQSMQQEAVKLSYRLNQMADSEVFSQETAREKQMGMLFCAPAMQLAIDVLREQVGATNVTAIDASNTHLLPSRSHYSLSKSNSNPGSSSPRSSVNYGASPTANASWLSRSSSSQEPSSPSWGMRTSLSPSEEEGITPATSDSAPDSPTRPFRSSAHGRHARSSSSAFSWGTSEDEMLSHNRARSPLRIITTSGDLALTSNVSTDAQSLAVGELFNSLKRRGLFTKPQMYNLNADVDSSDDEEEGAPSANAHRVKNTLGPILPEKAQLCVAIPVFSNDRSQPLFLLVCTWDHTKALVQAERYFCYSVGLILGATAFRQQASMSDRHQLAFIRSVQHELRTPLNGILGITDFLRQNLVHGDEADKLDLTQDGTLANLLESIRLSGVTLSTILDDVLDFGAVTGVAGGQAKATTRIEEVDLEREVEDVCLDELEHISMHERQDQHLRIGHRGYSAVPTLLIRVSPEVQSRFRTDRSKLKKILSKFVANALRYTDEHELVEVVVQPTQRRDSAPSSGSSDRWVDFIIHDTGMGMSKDFLVNSLLKPFSKADSFSQGVGLGVTIAANLIAQLGGKFSVQSELGSGTHVQVSLPLGVAAPLRQRAARTSSQGVGVARPYQVKTAAFYGFESDGQKAIAELITERLVLNKVEIVDAHASPELLILQESTLFRPSEDGSLSETPFAALPHAAGPRSRTLIVTRTALRSRTSSALDGQTIWFFRPPFGRDSLELMDEFLREEAPMVLRRVPTPTHAAGKNLDKIRVARQGVEAAAGTGSVDPFPALAAPAKANSVGADEADSVANSTATATTAVSSAPPASPSLRKARELAANVEDDKRASGGEGAAEAAKVSPSEGKPFRILVVEDNPVNMKLITTLLTREKYSFVEAKDGVEAVERYKEFAPSVVLLDISLPLLDGFGACLQMRDHELLHIPKIIAITALSSTADKVRGLEECGMDDWRTKPLSIKTLRTDLVAWKRDWEEAWGTMEGVASGAAAVATVTTPTAATVTV